MKPLVALVGAVLVAGAACSDDGSSADGGPVEIVFQVEGEQEELAVYEALVAEFEDRQSEIDVKLEQVAGDEDQIQKLTTAFAAGDPPDVFLVNYREYSQFAAQGALEPVGAHLVEMGVSIADYYEPPIEAFTFQGELQCMPQNISSLVVYYNTDLFARAGLKHPASWTWDGFRSAAMELTGGDVHGLGIEPNVIRIAPFAWSNGGEIVDDPDRPTRFTFDDPASREALDFIVSLVRDDEVVPSEEDVAAQDLETRFVTGKLGMLLSSRRDTPVFREVAGLQWDVAPLPAASTRAGILHSDGYCLAGMSERLDAAARFVAFATGEDGETITALAGRTVPSLKSVANSGAFLDPTQAPAHGKVFLDAIPDIRRTPVIFTWAEIEDVAEEFITRIFYEPGYSVDQGLADLDAATRSLFEEAAGP